MLEPEKSSYSLVAGGIFLLANFCFAGGQSVVNVRMLASESGERHTMNASSTARELTPKF